MIYFDKNVTINGIYILFPIVITYIDKSVNKHNVTFPTDTEDNIRFIQQISEFEKKILDYYKLEYGIQKNASRTLWNQLITGKIKLYKENSGTFRYFFARDPATIAIRA